MDDVNVLGQPDNPACLHRHTHIKLYLFSCAVPGFGKKNYPSFIGIPNVKDPPALNNAPSVQLFVLVPGMSSSFFQWRVFDLITRGACVTNTE